MVSMSGRGLVLTLGEATGSLSKAFEEQTASPVARDSQYHPGLIKNITQEEA
jgi:hypothetical protein